MAREHREESDSQAVAPSLQRIGVMLREAREAKGLNVEDVAARLHLSARVVRILEDGAFERLPAATYARGYLRAYANFVDLGADSLLVAYDQHADRPPDLNPFASAPHRQIQASDLPVRAVTYTVVAILLSLLGVWLWQTQKVGSLASLSVPKWGAESGEAGSAIVEPVVPVDSVEVATNPPPSGLGYSYPVVEHPQNLPPAASIPASGGGGERAVTISETTTAASLPVTETAATTPAQDVSASNASVAATEQIPAAPSDPATADNASVRTVAPTPLPMAAAPGNQVLTLELAEDAWVEVMDAEQKRLYYNLGRQGSRISVQGVMPYNVKVGNADNVRVSYEGRELDIVPFSDEAVARFKVTPDGFLALP